MKLSGNTRERLIQLQHPWPFIEHCVFTQDEVDVKNPVKAAPVHLGYLETITHVWVENNKLIVDKSRRMWISWLFLSLHLHMAFTNTNRRIGIVSKKFEDACAHLVNMQFIWEHIPEEIYPAELRPQMRTKEGFIFFDEIGSTIHALASGPDQARQYGFSALFFDEFDFWSEQESTYAAAKPTLQGGGKISIATTHCPQTSGVESFYKQLLEDNL
jgi:phage FluMu gp28-like protein